MEFVLSNPFTPRSKSPGPYKSNPLHSLFLDCVPVVPVMVSARLPGGEVPVSLRDVLVGGRAWGEHQVSSAHPQDHPTKTRHSFA
jgi:hypothetical protein